jgi:tRNA(fMet)-specific endonuclease VapC
LRKYKKQRSKDFLLRKQRAIDTITNLTENLSQNEKLKITIFNQGEIYTGAYCSKNKQKAIKEIDDFLKEFEILPFTINDAIKFGEIKAQLKEKGKNCGDMDILIATIVINNEEILYTNNINHFSNIFNLKICDWMQ